MDYKIIDDSDKAYIKVQCPVLNEPIVIHPSVLEDSIIKDNILIAPDDHSFVKRNIHAIRCNCSECTGLKVSFVKELKKAKIPNVIITK